MNIFDGFGRLFGDAETLDLGLRKNGSKTLYIKFKRCYLCPSDISRWFSNHVRVGQLSGAPGVLLTIHRML